MKFNLKDITQIAIILGAIVLVALFFPIGSDSINSHRIGDIWDEEDFYADHDFNILKDQLTIETEKKIIKENTPPIFKTSSVSEQKKQELKAKLTKFYANLGESRSAEIDQMLVVLNTILDKGVRSNNGIEYAGKTLETIKLNRPNHPAELVAVSGINTPNRAEYEFSDWMNANHSEYYTGILTMVYELIEPNIILDETATDKVLQEAYAAIEPNLETVKANSIIVKKGQRIDKDIQAKLQSYQKLGSATSTDSAWYRFFGFLLLTSLILGVLGAYLKFNFPSYLAHPPTLIFIFIWPVIISFLVNIVESTPNLSSYMIPFCIIPIVVMNFLNQRLALYLHITIVLIASYLSKLDYEFTFITILTGIATILFISETRSWNKFFSTIYVIFATYVLSYIGLEIIKTDQISQIQFGEIKWFCMATILTLLAYPFIPLIERIFGFTSSITLVELADMNNPLLKELSLKASGTLQHSLQVANLSEAAADSIGANSLLVKTGALYHDIGKLSRPSYFIENQSGKTNPHDALSNFESAAIIIDHVNHGAELARKHKLPKEIVDFINTHHGTTKVEYFLRRQLKDNPDQEFDESLFSYPGPLPQTKEQSILMIADSIEAAAKSMNNPTIEDIENLVSKIIAHKIDDNQLLASSLSFTELEKCKEVFIDLLKNIYHVRIAYPARKEVEMGGKRVD